MDKEANMAASIPRAIMRNYLVAICYKSSKFSTLKKPPTIPEDYWINNEDSQISPISSAGHPGQ